MSQHRRENEIIKKKKKMQLIQEGKGKRERMGKQEQMRQIENKKRDDRLNHIYNHIKCKWPNP